MSEVQDLRQAADEAAGGAEGEAERQGREVERLTAERRQALLDGDDAALGRAEAALTTAGRERERALLKGEAILERSFQAMRTAKTQARAAAGREVGALCRERLGLAEKIDALVAELAPLARE